MSHEPECPPYWAAQILADDCSLCKIIRAWKTKGDLLTLREVLLATHNGNQDRATAALAEIDQINAHIRDRKQATDDR